MLLFIETLRALFRNSHYLFTSLFIAVALLATVIVIVHFRNKTKQRINRFNPLMPGGIDLDTLKGIEQTGLISEQELKRLKTKMAEQYLDEKVEAEKPPRELSAQVYLDQAEVLARAKAERLRQQQRRREAAAVERDPPTLDFVARDQPAADPSAAAAAQTSGGTLAPEQAELVRKQLDLETLSMDEAVKLLGMGVLTPAELAQVHERDKQGADGAARAMPAEPGDWTEDKLLHELRSEAMTLDEVEELMIIGEISRELFEELRKRLNP